jgi:hypothetical protein
MLSIVECASGGEITSSKHPRLWLYPHKQQFVSCACWLAAGKNPLLSFHGSRMQAKVTSLGVLHCNKDSCSATIRASAQCFYRSLSWHCSTIRSVPTTQYLFYWWCCDAHSLSRCCGSCCVIAGCRCCAVQCIEQCCTAFLSGASDAMFVSMR